MGLPNVVRQAWAMRFEWGASCCRASRPWWIISSSMSVHSAVCFMSTRLNSCFVDTGPEIGLTRDPVADTLTLNGRKLELVDTAGALQDLCACWSRFYCRVDEVLCLWEIQWCWWKACKGILLCSSKNNELCTCGGCDAGCLSCTAKQHSHELCVVSSVVKILLCIGTLPAGAATGFSCVEWETCLDSCNQQDGHVGYATAADRWEGYCQTRKSFVIFEAWTRSDRSLIGFMR